MTPTLACAPPHLCEGDGRCPGRPDRQDQALSGLCQRQRGRHHPQGVGGGGMRVPEQTHGRQCILLRRGRGQQGGTAHPSLINVNEANIVLKVWECRRCGKGENNCFLPRPSGIWWVPPMTLCLPSLPPVRSPHHHTHILPFPSLPSHRSSILPPFQDKVDALAAKHPDRPPPSPLRTRWMRWLPSTPTACRCTTLSIRPAGEGQCGRAVSATSARTW